MKILHIIPTYKPAFVYGGPIFSVALLCENLALAGHEMTVFSTTANGPAELDIPPGTTRNVEGVQVTYFRRLTKDHTHFSPALMWQVWRQCRRFQVIHLHAWWTLPILFSVLICWLRGVKPVLSPRGMLSDFSFQKNHSSGKGLFHAFAGKFLLKKTCLHLTAEAESQETAGLGSSRFVLPNLIQLAPPHTAPARDNAEFVILFLSRIHPKKNIEGLIEALSRVSFDFRLQIAGNGEPDYLEKLKSLIAAKNLENKTAWIGEAYDAEKFRLYAAADLLVLPSFNENFANVVIEALSAGTPVLVSDAVGLSDYVRSNDLGWVCETAPEAIAQALTDAFMQKQKRDAIRQKAPGLIRREFSQEQLIEQYLEAYKIYICNA